jgi:hypothetical protein
MPHREGHGWAKGWPLGVSRITGADSALGAQSSPHAHSTFSTLIYLSSIAAAQDVDKCLRICAYLTFDLRVS